MALTNETGKTRSTAARLLGRSLGVVGFVALLSVPLTLFLWEWQFTWVALAKLLFGLAAVGIWLATNFRGIRERVQGRTVFYGSFTALFVITSVAAVVVVNYLAHRNPLRFDLTRKQIFSLSEQSLDVLASLEDDVRVLAFYGAAQQAEQDLVRQVLDQYRYASGRFHYELLDPVVRQDLVETYKIRRGGPRLIVKYRDREARVDLDDRAHNSPAEALTGALLEVTTPEQRRRVCFSRGHGELALDGKDPRRVISLLVRDLQGEGYTPDVVSLLRQPQIPSGCRVFVLAGPKRDLLQEELDSLGKHVGEGRRLMVFLGADDAASPAPLLRRFGLEIGDNTVIHPDSRMPLNVVTDPMRYPKTHPVFARFFTGGAVMLEQLEAVFPLARSIGVLPAAPQRLRVTAMAYTSESAWGEAGKVREGVELAFDSGKDLKGPVPLAAAVEMSPDAGGGRLAVFGSSLMVTDAAYRVYPFNRNLVMNTLAWLAQEEKKITIRPRYRAASLLRLKESELKFITFFCTDILPLLILAVGISIWQIRRSS